MLLVTGLLTYVIPSGTFDHLAMRYTDHGVRGIPLRDWVGAPLLVLTGDTGPQIIAIVLFILIIGGAIRLLQDTGLIEGAILAVVRRFYGNGFVLLCILVLVFMSLGSFGGIFEEVVPLVPLMMLLAKRMGWDELTGLGASMLATGLGFAAAVTNPFTIGVAQELAGLPLFSGASLRVLVFVVVYATLVAFLAFRIPRRRDGGEASPPAAAVTVPVSAYRFFISLMILMAITVVAMPLFTLLQAIALPLIALIFLVAGLGVGLIVKGNGQWVTRTFLAGARDLSPAIVLILLASGIKHVLEQSGILDTILYFVAQRITLVSPLTAVFLVFALVMGLNFFIGSGSAKAFILMPILMPLMDVIGVGRQLGVLAFQFGDGFSNVLYPTNAVLLISLALAKVSYARWFAFVLPLQIVLTLVSLAFLALGLHIGYGL
jgi:uncharacterized ion transporter superfamily protein YfcC